MVLFAGVFMAGSDEPVNLPCGDIERFTDPAICLSTPIFNLTLDRKSGRIGMYLSATANRWTASPVGLDVLVSPPSNPSEVKLLSGGRGFIAHLEVSSSKPVKDRLLQQIQTSPDNPTSGRLDNQKVKILGTSLQITVLTQP